VGRRKSQAWSGASRGSPSLSRRRRPGHLQMSSLDRAEATRRWSGDCGGGTRDRAATAIQPASSSSTPRPSAPTSSGARHDSGDRQRPVTAYRAPDVDADAGQSRFRDPLDRRVSSSTLAHGTRPPVGAREPDATDGRFEPPPARSSRSPPFNGELLLPPGALGRRGLHADDPLLGASTPPRAVAGGRRPARSLRPSLGVPTTRTLRLPAFTPSSAS